MVEVLGTAEFEEWFLGLGHADAQAVVRVVGLLEAKGSRLAFLTLRHSKTADLRYANCASRAWGARCGSSTPSIRNVKPS
jgi:hypothetical protein